MAQIEQIFNAFSPVTARHIVPTFPGTARQGKCAPYASVSG
jgi:hypothetical protein